VDADLTHCADRCLTVCLGERHPAPDQILPAEREEVEDLGLWKSARHPVALQRARQHHSPPIDLGKQQRIDDRERDLVTQRGTALGVTEQD
jgi:hypothetical protein